MAEMGHSRPMGSGPVPINVRCYFDSGIIVLRSEVTRRANGRHHAVTLTLLCSCLAPLRAHRPRLSGSQECKKYRFARKAASRPLALGQVDF